MKRTIIFVLCISALLTACGTASVSKAIADDDIAPVVTKKPVSTKEPTNTKEPIGVTSAGTPIIDKSDYDSVKMQSTPNSTCFSEIGYYDGDLFVVFRDSGAEYVYRDVPKYVWNELNDADSMGRYYNSNIKGNYDCEKLG